MGTHVAPWKQLLFGAIEANSHLSHSSYVQLATIGLNGRPSNRTVVFRGFEENSDRIQINTDLRSRKVLVIFSDYVVATCRFELSLIDPVKIPVAD
jgi:hypothetical protein